MSERISLCPTNVLFGQLSKQWILLIIHSLQLWETSFSWLKRSLLWISSRTLSLRLKELQYLWFINRNIVQEQPIKIEYKLSEKWHSLSYELEKLWEWAKQWN